jgi:hypothetical protein
LNKWVNHIKLFWYFASNWNLRLALFILFHEIKGEKKYTLYTFVPAELSRLTIRNGDISRSSRYEAVNFYILEALLQRITEMGAGRSFTDLGCGKGRAMAVAAHYGFTTIRGIDFAAEVCKSAEENMRNITQLFPSVQYEVICDNVAEYKIQPDESVFFMFNPFDDTTIRTFLEKVERSIDRFPRTVYFLYASPKHIDVFFDFEYEPVYRKRKLKWLDGVILKKETLTNE